MSSSFFKPFYYFFILITVLILFLSCFFGPTILGNYSESADEPYYSFDLTGKYIWPSPRLYYY